MKNKILICIFLFLFIILGFLCINGYTKELDMFIYQTIIKYKNPFFTFILKSISFLFSTSMIILYCILSFVLLKNKKQALIFSIIMAFQAVVNNIVKIIFKRARPNILPLVVEKSYSFPSGHTMAAVFLVMIWGHFLHKKYPHIQINLIQIGVIFLIGVSRIYLGVHYFTDIIGALILSFLLFLFLKDDKIRCRLEQVLVYDN